PRAGVASCRPAAGSRKADGGAAEPVLPHLLAAGQPGETAGYDCPRAEARELAPRRWLASKSEACESTSAISTRSTGWTRRFATASRSPKCFLRPRISMPATVAALDRK